MAGRRIVRAAEPRCSQLHTVGHVANTVFAACALAFVVLQCRLRCPDTNAKPIQHPTTPDKPTHNADQQCVRRRLHIAEIPGIRGTIPPPALGAQKPRSARLRVQRHVAGLCRWFVSGERSQQWNIELHRKTEPCPSHQPSVSTAYTYNGQFAGWGNDIARRAQHCDVCLCFGGNSETRHDER